VTLSVLPAWNMQIAQVLVSKYLPQPGVSIIRAAPMIREAKSKPSREELIALIGALRAENASLKSPDRGT
jgi:hypothetical protein